MSATHIDAGPATRSWVIAGLVGGIIAGIVFAMFEMIVAAIMGDGFFAPLMMIGAIVLGQGALPMPEPTIGLSTIVPVGIAVHMVLSMLYGVVFGAVASSVDFLRNNRWALIGVATVFGFALWIVNFYVVAPVLFPWFGMANPVVQFFAHTFFFGTALGLVLAARAQPDEEAEGSEPSVHTGERSGQVQSRAASRSR
jgi:hypothetical protein